MLKCKVYANLNYFGKWYTVNKFKGLKSKIAEFQPQLKIRNENEKVNYVFHLHTLYGAS